MSDLIPEGRHDAVAVLSSTDDDSTERYIHMGESKSGKPQLCVVFEVTNGPSQGRQLRWYPVITEKTVDWVLASLRAMGHKGDQMVDDAQQLDQVVSLVISHNEWEGKVTARVDWVNAKGSSVVKMHAPMSQDKIRTWNAKMAARFSTTAPVDGVRHNPEAAKASTPTVIGEPVKLDDIPF